MTDEQWKAFQQRGGVKWLRRLTGAMPVKYYEVFQKPGDAGKVQLKRND